MSKILELPTWYYRQFPCDYSQGERATEGILGWAQRVCLVPKEQAALVLMHLWNIGFPGGPAWGAGVPQQVRRDAQEFVGRCVKTFTTALPPVLRAARACGLTIVHVASGRGYAERYPQYQRTLTEVTTPAPAPPEGAIRPKDADVPTTDERFGPGFSKVAESEALDFPEGLGPEGDDLVAVTTHELNTLLRNRRVWHLTYCGFAINWCLWHSPGGMVDMRRLGYTCGCIKQGTVAVESKESVATLGNHAYSMWKTAHMFGFVADDHDFIQACQKGA